MLVQGGVTRRVKQMETAEFVRFVAQRAPASHYFVVDPPPGISMASAMEWRIVLAGASALAEVGAALWQAYETFVRGEGSAGELLVQVKNRKKAFDQFVVGREIGDEKALLHRLTESARLLAPKGGEESVEEELAETEDSGYWARVV
ncbi:MAG TPA: hypothetical protein VI389_07735 [Geobacteraceae bacterium]